MEKETQQLLVIKEEDPLWMKIIYEAVQKKPELLIEVA